MPNSAAAWFESWFDTDYYHILYKNRDYAEAQFFIDNLCNLLNVDKDSKVLDLACGKGRHSLYLSQKGYDVTGVDLSPNSIQAAKSYEQERLRFLIKDMRQDLGPTEYDVVFNLFTSFGYFDTEAEHLDVFKAVKKVLGTNGIFVLDYFNTANVIKMLPKSEHKEIDGIQFDISKSVIGTKIVKEIVVNDMGHVTPYYEKVSAFTLSDFIKMFEDSGFEIQQLKGNYNLDDYSEASERMIFVARAL